MVTSVHSTSPMVRRNEICRGNVLVLCRYDWPRSCTCYAHISRSALARPWLVAIQAAGVCLGNRECAISLDRTTAVAQSMRRIGCWITVMVMAYCE